jgi:hypothetical protein
VEPRLVGYTATSTIRHSPVLSMTLNLDIIG